MLRPAIELYPPPHLPQQAGLLYRAIKMNVKLYRWERALDLAQQYKQHIETVLWYRRRYLLAAAGDETIARFKDLTEQVWICGGGGGGLPAHITVCWLPSSSGRALSLFLLLSNSLRYLTHSCLSGAAFVPLSLSLADPLSCSPPGSSPSLADPPGRGGHPAADQGGEGAGGAAARGKEIHLS